MAREFRFVPIDPARRAAGLPPRSGWCLGRAWSVSTYAHTNGCTFTQPRAIFSALAAHMRSQRTKWFMTVLAVLFNLGGGPMAWAHLAGAAKCHDSAPAVAQMSPDCPQHHLGKTSGDRHASAPHTLPCCAGGSCACGAPFSMPASASFVPSSSIIIGSIPEPPVATAPSAIIDDALRPPIS